MASRSVGIGSVAEVGSTVSWAASAVYAQKFATESAYGTKMSSKSENESENVAEAGREAESEPRASVDERETASFRAPR